MAEVAATAAPLDVHSGAKQPFASGLEPCFTVDPASCVPQALARLALGLQKAAHRFSEHFVVFAKHSAGEGQNTFHSISLGLASHVSKG